MTKSLKDAIQNRRSYYQLQNSSPVSDEKNSVNRRACITLCSISFQFTNSSSGGSTW